MPPQPLPDRSAHDSLYRGTVSPLAAAGSIEAYCAAYERTHLSPYWTGGRTKGFVAGMAARALLTSAERVGLPPERLLVLDAACGQGELSVYLACRGFHVVGVDISREGCEAAARLARQLGVGTSEGGRCRFIAASLENLPLPGGSVDFVIGHAALHHFIKYAGVSAEFARVLKGEAMGFFADSFGENPLFRVFHDRARMTRLGDVPLTAAMIRAFFSQFAVDLVPADWFTMLDKLYERISGRRFRKLRRRLSRLHFGLDRLVPTQSRLALACSGSVMTVIRRKDGAPAAGAAGAPGGITRHGEPRS
jgi:ubiquinone/menaquinone biosynthesis C-methylase UbiE